MSGNRREDDRGTALIEAAFVLPVVLILLFGIIEVGFLFRSGAVAVSATRAGARVAAAAYGDTMNYAVGPVRAAQQAAVVDSVASSVSVELKNRGTTDTPVDLWIYYVAPGSTNSLPPSGNTTSCGSNCYLYTWNAGTAAFVRSGASPGWALPDACGATLDSVGVLLRMRHTAIAAPVSLPINSIVETASMRLEPRTGCLTVEGPN